MQKNISVTSEDNLLIYGAYLQVAISLQHSNMTQLIYKSLTITWLIATFIGAGYSLSSTEINLPLNPLLIVTSLCSASLLVISLIWYLDLIVQEKKIATAVHMGLKLEKQYPQLPRAYHNVVHLYPFLGYIFMKCIFYWGCILILLLTICASLCAYVLITHVAIDWRIIPLITSISTVALFMIFHFMTKKANLYPFLEKIYQQEQNNGHR